MKNGYEWRLVDDARFVVKYEFVDDFENRFLVVFRNDKVGPSDSPRLGNSFEITYFVWDTDVEEWSINKMVSTNVHRLMRTIFGSVLDDFVRERNFISLIRVEGIPRVGEDPISRNARTKLYLRHLSGNPLGGYEVDSDGRNKIFLIKRKR